MHAMAMHGAASREAYVKIDERAKFMIVYPSRAGMGVRHATIAGSERSLCGRRCEWWFRTLAFDAATLGCKTCKLRVEEEHTA